MKLRDILFTTIIGGMVATAAAQTSTPMSLKWKVQADDPQSTYILSSGDQCRGMYLNKTAGTGGSLLVASRANGNLVRRLDPETGALKDPAVMPGGYMTTGNTFPLNKVVVSTDGIIYVGGLGQAGATEAHFRLYRHENEFSAPVIVGDVRTDNAGFGVRLGDDMDIIDTGNDTKILVSGYQPATGLALFTTSDGGLTFTGTKITCTPPLVGNGSISWDPDVPNRFWYRDATPNIHQAYDISGSAATGASGPGNELPGTSLLAYGPFDIGKVNGVKSVALGIGASLATTPNKEVLIYSLSDVVNPDYFGIGSGFSPGGAKANGNAAGSVYLDVQNQLLYVLYTNNSITKFDMLDSNVRDWNIY